VKNEPCDDDDEEEDDGIDNFVTPIERPPKKFKNNSEAALHAGSEMLINDENVMHLPFVRCVYENPFNKQKYILHVIWMLSGQVVREAVIEPGGTGIKLTVTWDQLAFNPTNILKFMPEPHDIDEKKFFYSRHIGLERAISSKKEHSNTEIKSIMHIQLPNGLVISEQWKWVQGLHNKKSGIRFLYLEAAEIENNYKQDSTSVEDVEF